MSEATTHLSDGMWEDGSGWWWGKCLCGHQGGPFPDRETAVDDLMSHAAEAALLGEES